jgi:putative glycosyltransferase (TIGR04372 family)
VPVANKQLLKMYKRKFPIFENWFLSRLIYDTGIKKTVFFMNLKHKIRRYDEFNNCAPVLNFSAGDKELGAKSLRSMGIGESDWFICFHARDSKYELDRLGAVFARRNDFRDADIYNYLPAAEYIAQEGGFAIRMGAAVEKALPKKRHPRIIDYALNFRSDFMDIYLAGNCKFFLGNTAGIYLVSTVFGIPSANANYIPYGTAPLLAKDLFIPKKIWDLKRKRFFTYQEILNSEMVHYFNNEQYLRAGIEAVENTADEILELAKEMNLRLDNRYTCDPESEELQQRFRALYKPNHYCYGFPSRIGAHFLRENKELWG